MAVSFLVALIIPGVIYGLEVIIGTVQALVFALLTVVFSVQAMEAHHGDDHDEHDDHGHPGVEYTSAESDGSAVQTPAH